MRIREPTVAPGRSHAGALPRAQPDLFGPVAFDPTVSRLIDRLAHDEAKALRAAREHAWDLARNEGAGHRRRAP
ncbi:hypothetical protein ABZ912_60220 [Nonomuraea angiospora]|uniref:hypothetical protein n=1 Tax=Nonomuraea angiospora TaxID=46172 RepID=UPI00340138E2